MKTTIHIGERIRERAKELRIGPTELSRMINTSKQNVYGIFKRKSVDTELLKAISEVLKFDFFSYYSVENLLAFNDEGKKNGKKNNHLKSTADIIKELHECRKEIEILKREFTSKEVSYLTRINELLEKNTKRK